MADSCSEYFSFIFVNLLLCVRVDCWRDIRFCHFLLQYCWITYKLALLRNIYSHQPETWIQIQLYVHPHILHSLRNLNFPLVYGNILTAVQITFLFYTYKLFVEISLFDTRRKNSLIFVRHWKSHCQSYFFPFAVGVSSLPSMQPSNFESIT